MTQRPYEFLARFNQQGGIAGAHARYITTVNGRDYEGDPQPISLDDPAFAEFATQFAAAVVAERDALAAQVQSLTAERDAAVSAKESAEATLAEVQAELDALKNPPINVRRLPPYSFLRRYTQEERQAIRAARRSDDIIDEILFILTTVRYVDLDDQDTQQGVGYIAQQGLIAPNRVAEILADALPEEL